MYGVIYKITNKINGKLYIGQTTRTPEERFIEHKYCQTSNIGRAIRKYGAENFTIEVLEECETAEQLNEREIFWIAELGCMYPNGYNNATGGQGNWERTPESIAKMSRKGKRHSKKSRLLIASSSTGRHPTDEMKQRIAKAQPNRRAVICVETGEEFETMAAAALCKNVSHPSITRACKNPNRTAGGFHWRFVDETLQNVTAQKSKPRPVICVETGEEFETMAAAAKHCNIDRQCISGACKDPLKLAAGFHWKFADEPQIETSAPATEIKSDNEARAKMSAAKLGKPLSDEHKATLSASVQTKKPVICVETGVIYESITEAARANNIKYFHIKRACQIPSRRAGGCHWIFQNPADMNTQTPAGTPTPKHSIICVETNEFFESISSAARSKNLRVTNISRACRNGRNTAGGCHWKFADEPEKI